MTATATSKAARRNHQRTMRIYWSATPLDTTVVSLSITDRQTDSYHVHHAADSCRVRWDHDDDSHRTYTVTCSAATGEPTACTCPARAYRAGECRHMAATRVLARRGELTLPRLTDAGHDRETCE